MKIEFVNPNLHVAIVHFPIALLIVGTLIELFSFMWRRHGFRAAGRWMILLGTLLSIPVALAGVYALYDVATMKLSPDEIEGRFWKEIASAGGLNAAQWAMLRSHLLLNIGAVACSCVAVVAWIGSSDRWRRNLHIPFLLLLLASCGLTLAGAWYGGEAVYRQATGVDNVLAAEVAPVAVDSPVGPIATPATTESVAPATPATTEPLPKAERSITDAIKATTNTAASAAAPAPPNLVPDASSATATQPGKMSLRDRIVAHVEYFTPPIQFHVILAGTTVAIALAALGLSIRKITQGPPVTQVDHIAAALGPPATLIGEGTDFARPDTDEGFPPMGAATSPGVRMASETPDVAEPLDLAVPRVPASRFWMLATLIAILTAATGWLTLAIDSNTWSLNDFFNGIVMGDARQHNYRLLAHAITGGALVVVPIILAILARWAPRRKWLLAFFATLALLAVASQIWIGLLLLFDSTQGPLRAFN